MTAAIATFSSVHSPKDGAIAIKDIVGSRSVPPSIRSTRSGVGGITGSPSLQPRSTDRALRTT